MQCISSCCPHFLVQAVELVRVQMQHQALPSLAYYIVVFFSQIQIQYAFWAVCPKYPLDFTSHIQPGLW
jgi:hypothetical protein